MTTVRLAATAMLVAVSGCTMSLNGKSSGFGPGTPSSGSSSSGSSSSGSSSSGSSSSASMSSGSSSTSESSPRRYGSYKEMGQTGATYPEATRTSETARYDKLPPYLSAPADPWAGVAGDQPLRWSEDDARYWIIRANEGDCTAAHDHCLIRDAWFTEADMARDRTVYRYAYPRVFGPDAPTNPKNASVGGSFSEDQGYTAYRSVPATRANLQPGALVLVLEDKKLPYDGRQAVEASWIIGPLDRVDHDNHKLYIVGRDKPEWLSAARVVVITWRPGEKIQIVGGAKRDSLAVSAKDVFLPVPD